MQIDIPALKRLWQQTFGDTEEFIDGFFRTGFSPNRCRCLYDGHRLTAALYWFDCTCRGEKLAYIYAVATDESYRGKGLCRQLTQQTHRHLQDQGYAGAILVPAQPELFEMYEKLGYRPCCLMDSLTVQAAGNAELTPISPTEYSNARRAFLPPDAVTTQNGLDFLLTYNGFYEAEGCIFCAAREGDRVYFQEFLGEVQKLPAVTAALGGKTAKVRLPGATPFAMYHGFTQPNPPSYFNLPMD